MSCGKKLQRFRIRHGLSAREAARQLHVVHVTLNDWECGKQTPYPDYRRAIEVWSMGEIQACEWPLSKREKRVRDMSALVCPIVSGAQK